MMAWRRISSLPERMKESRAPEFESETAITLSSIDATCAPAVINDQVRRRRAFTFSMISGQSRRTPSKSMGPVGFAVGALFTSTGGAATGASSSTSSIARGGAFFTGAATGAATGLFTEVDGSATSPRRSKRSSLANTPLSLSSEPGRRTRAQINSRSKRGAVAPRICVRPSFTTSAARESEPRPKRAACCCMRSN